MTITLTVDEWYEIFGEPIHVNDINKFDSGSKLTQFLWEVPRKLGKGYRQEMDLHPELWLDFTDAEYKDDVFVTYSEGQHDLHFEVLLSGKVVSERGQCGESYTLVCGGGIQQKGFTKIKKNQHLVGVGAGISRQLLATLFPGKDGDLIPQLQKLFNDDDLHPVFYPQSTPTIYGVAQQILNCPFHGVTKQIYLQGKIFELIALQLAPILENEEKNQTPSLRPNTIARIHQARDILRSRMENPPSSLELAQIVGVSDRTLRRGFRELFGTTVFTSLTVMRMEMAERLLREGNCTVAEVANIVGYSHLGLFASVFKRQYGIRPKECLMGKKSVS